MYDSSPSKIRDSMYPKVQNMTSYEFHDFVTYELEEVLDSMEISVTNPLVKKNGSFYANWAKISKLTAPFVILHPSYTDPA